MMMMKPARTLSATGRGAVGGPQQDNDSNDDEDDDADDADDDNDDTDDDDNDDNDDDDDDDDDNENINTKSKSRKLNYNKKGPIKNDTNSNRNNSKK